MENFRLQKQIDKLVARQASDWIEALRTAGPQERAAFVAWLKGSRRNVEEFLTMVALDRELGRIDAARAHDLDALLARVSPDAARVRSFSVSHVEPGERELRHRSRRLRRPAALAAGLVAGALALWFVHVTIWPWRHYATTVGEQRTVELSDGSVVHLNTRSAISVRFDSGARDIRLVRGEALFDVARDPARTFQVYTRDATIQAIGTQFNVDTSKEETTVAVLEGRVNVSRRPSPGMTGSAPETLMPTALQAGEEAKISDGKIQTQPLADADKTVAWRQRRLVFNDDTLEEMVAEFNRYNRVPQFRLEGQAVRRRHYSGTFDADDPQSLAALLAREQDIEVETTAREIVIRPRS